MLVPISHKQKTPPPNNPIPVERYTSIRRTDHGSTDSGAMMLEFVLVFPILLALIFIVLWTGYITNAKSAFLYATKASARGALTRGNLYSMNGELLLKGTEAPVNSSSWWNWYESSNGNRDLFCNLKGSDCDDANKRWTKPLWGISDGDWCPSETDSLKKMPPSYHYALLYTYKSVYEAIGDTVRYPCDPEPLDSASNGCVRCYLQIPSCADTVLPESNVTLKCEYRPDNILMSPIIALLGTLTSDPQLGLISSTITAIVGD